MPVEWARSEGALRAAGQRSGPAGYLVLVVAPDQMGPDVLLTAVRRRMAAFDSIEFPKLITTRRSGSPDMEVCVTREVFRDMERDDSLIVSWTCEGVGFGLPASVGLLLSQGKTVVIAASLSASAEVARKIARVRVFRLVGPLDTARSALTPQACLRRMVGHRLGQRLEMRAINPRTEIISWVDVPSAVRRLTERLTRMARESETTDRGTGRAEAMRDSRGLRAAS